MQFMSIYGKKKPNDFYFYYYDFYSSALQIVRWASLFDPRSCNATLDWQHCMCILLLLPLRTTTAVLSALVYSARDHSRLSWLLHCITLVKLRVKLNTELAYRHDLTAVKNEDRERSPSRTHPEAEPLGIDGADFCYKPDALPISQPTASTHCAFYFIF